MIKEYITYLRDNRQLSANTITAYSNDLGAWVIWAKCKSLRWSTIEKQHIDQWVADMTASGLKPRTIKRRVSALRSLLRWSTIEKMIPSNEARFVQTPKPADTLPESADLTALNDYLGKPITDHKSAMVHAMIALLMDTGIRIQEALEIRKEDFNRAQRAIRIHGKGNKERIVYYTDRAAQNLTRFCGNIAAGRLFTTDQRSMRYAIYNELHTWGLTATHPHAIRHAYATGMLVNGIDIKTLSWLLGHKSVKTTEIYTRAVNNTIAERYHKYHV